VDHALFESDLWERSERTDYKQKAQAQLGTVGSGNHYVDLMRDEEGHVWIGVHFGSRGLGHSTATKYLKLAGGKDGMNCRPLSSRPTAIWGAPISPAWSLAAYTLMSAGSGSSNASAR
jgi:RNA-splicing ligase RtcB